MLKKLTEEQQANILESAIEEFGDRGYADASISAISKAAGVSVGVIYKYYLDKEALFTACIDRSLLMLEKSLQTAAEVGDSLGELMKSLICVTQSFAKEYPAYIRMYHAITMTDSSDQAASLAMEIEMRTSQLYTSVISKAKLEGKVRKDLDPAYFAFFFDNLMMLLHFSYSCDYYRERFKLYCGESALENDTKAVEQLGLFMEYAFGLGEE